MSTRTFILPMKEFYNPSMKIETQLITSMLQRAGPLVLIELEVKAATRPV